MNKIFKLTTSNIVIIAKNNVFEFIYHSDLLLPFPKWSDALQHRLKCEYFGENDLQIENILNDQ